MMIDRFIADEKEFPRAKLLCINIERGTILNAIDLWQIVTISPVSVFKIYNSQE